MTLAALGSGYAQSTSPTCNNKLIEGNYGFLPSRATNWARDPPANRWGPIRCAKRGLAHLYLHYPEIGCPIASWFSTLGTMVMVSVDFPLLKLGFPLPGLSARNRLAISIVVEAAQAAPVAWHLPYLIPHTRSATAPHRLTLRMPGRTRPNCNTAWMKSAALGRSLRCPAGEKLVTEIGRADCHVPGV